MQSRTMIKREEDLQDFNQLHQINQWMSEDPFNSDSPLFPDHTQPHHKNLTLNDKIEDSIAILQRVAPKTFNNKFVQDLRDKIKTASETLPAKTNNDRATVLEPLEHQNDAVSTNCSRLNQAEGQDREEKPREMSPQATKSPPQQQQGGQPQLALDENEGRMPVKKEQTEGGGQQEGKIQKIGNLVIECFCQKGFKVDYMKEELYVNGFTKEVNAINYQQFIRDICIKAFDKLQIFLKAECELEIPSLKVQFGQEKVADTLTYCQDNFSPESCRTLVEIIRDDNGFTTTSQVDANCAVKLFEEVEDKLHYIYRPNVMLRQDRHAPLTIQSKETTRNQEKQSGYRYQFPKIQTPKFYSDKATKRSHKSTYEVKEHPLKMNDIEKMNSIWTVEYEMEVIIGYKAGRTINEITEGMRISHPQDKQNITSSGVRSNIFKILRQAIHKLYDYVYLQGKADFPHVKRLNYVDVRYIIHNGASLPCRILLMDIYCSRKYDKRLVENTINEIEYYLLGLHREKEKSQFRQKRQIGQDKPPQIKARQRYRNNLAYNSINMFDSKKYISH